MQKAAAADSTSVSLFVCLPTTLTNILAGLDALSEGNML